MTTAISGIKSRLTSLSKNKLFVSQGLCFGVIYIFNFLVDYYAVTRLSTQDADDYGYFFSATSVLAILALFGLQNSYPLTRNLLPLNLYFRKLVLTNMFIHVVFALIFFNGTAGYLFAILSFLKSMTILQSSLLRFNFHAIIGLVSRITFFLFGFVIATFYIPSTLESLLITMIGLYIGIVALDFLLLDLKKPGRSFNGSDWQTLKLTTPFFAVSVVNILVARLDMLFVSIVFRESSSQFFLNLRMAEMVNSLSVILNFVFLATLSKHVLSNNIEGIRKTLRNYRLLALLGASLLLTLIATLGHFGILEFNWQLFLPIFLGNAIFFLLGPFGHLINLKTKGYYVSKVLLIEILLRGCLYLVISFTRVEDVHLISTILAWFVLVFILYRSVSYYWYFQRVKLV